MDFALTAAQQVRREQAREIVAREVAPIAAAVPSGGQLTAPQIRQIYKSLIPTGYLGSTISRDLGGAGLSFVDYGLLLEALGASPVLLAEIVPPRTIANAGSPE